jgi:hypothetical protein
MIPIYVKLCGMSLHIPFDRIEMAIPCSSHWQILFNGVLVPLLENGIGIE